MGNVMPDQDFLKTPTLSKCLRTGPEQRPASCKSPLRGKIHLRGKTRLRAVSAVLLGTLGLYGLVGLLPQHAAHAQTSPSPFAPALVLSVGAIPDPPRSSSTRYQPEPSFNDTIRRGAERFAQETGTAVTTVIDDATGDAAELLRQRIRDGATLVIAAAGAHRHAAAVETVAAEYPAVHFVLLDAESHRPNVTSIIFKEQQAAYLAGIVAASMSKNGVIGFVGGMDNPVIRRFRCGYEAGARTVNPSAHILGSYIDISAAGFRSPQKAAKLARVMIDRGADVLFAAAGRSGLGVLDEAAEHGRYSIGVDANQNGRHPGLVLTSALKRVDIAVYRALREARNGTLRSGVQALGLAEDAVGLSQDANNALVVPETVWEKVDVARSAIVTGQSRILDTCD